MEDKVQRTKALELAIASVEKEFGRGAIMRLKEGENIGGDIQVLPSGSIGLDVALGIGGYPKGRIVEIFGPESSGKTTLALHAIANVQRQGGVAAFIDAEHALDVTYARKLGVKSEELLISQPDFGEQALEIGEMLVRSGAVDIVVVDSVAALTPKAEIEGDMGDVQPGAQARLMSQALRKLTGAVSRSRCIFMFTNQMRMKIGVMFGNPETTSGGNALKFYASVRLDVRRIGAIKEAAHDAKGEMTVVGNRTRVKVVKNKVAPPFREVEFDIIYGRGVSRSGEIIDMASDTDIVEKSGSWFAVEGQRIGQGRDAARTFLEQHVDLMERLEARVLEHHGIRRNAKNDGAEGPASGAGGGAEGTVAVPKPGAPNGTPVARRPPSPRPS